MKAVTNSPATRSSTVSLACPQPKVIVPRWIWIAGILRASMAGKAARQSQRKRSVHSRSTVESSTAAGPGRGARALPSPEGSILGARWVLRASSTCASHVPLWSVAACLPRALPHRRCVAGDTSDRAAVPLSGFKYRGVVQEAVGGDGTN